MSRVKIAEEIVFLFFFSEFFRTFSKFFSDFWPKNFKNLSKLPSTCPEEQFVAWFFLSFESFPIFCRNRWHGSQISIYVSRVKIAEKTVFFAFFPEFFSNFEQIIFRLLAKKIHEFDKTTFYVSRGTLCGLIFFKFWNFRIFCRNIWHGSQNYIYVSRVKIAEKTVFFVFFSEFFRIMSENFSDFWPKNFKKIVKTTFCVSTGTTCGFKLFKKFWTVLDFLQSLWCGSQKFI